MTRTAVAAPVAAKTEFPETVRPVVESLILRNPALRPHLALNPSLSEATWLDLYKAKPLPKASIAESLAGRGLSKTQRLHVLEHERRGKVLKALVAANELDREEQERLLASPGFTEAVAVEMIEAPWCDDDLKKPLALKVGGQVLLSYLASAPDSVFPTDEAATLLSDFRSWGPSLSDDSPRGKRARSQALAQLLSRRPDLLPAALVPGQHDSVVTAAAGCRHLLDVTLQYQAAGFVPGQADVPLETLQRKEFLLMALVNNPPADPGLVDDVIRLAERHGMFKLANSARSRKVKHPEALTTPYELLEDQEALRWIAFRVLPSEYKPDGRPFDVPALGANPNLPDVFAERIRAGLAHGTIGEALGQDLPAAVAAFAAAHPGLVGDVDDFAHDPVRYSPDPFRRGFDAPEATVLTWPVASLVYDDYLHQTVELAITRFGVNPSAWESFLTLVEEFDGSVGELLDLCSML